VRKYTNHGATLPSSFAPYTHYTTGSSSSCRRPRSSTPSPSSSSDDDKAEEGRVIGPEDFIKDEAEEARALVEVLAEMAEAATAEQTAEEADRRAMLCAIEAFQAREAARV
jgi:hypothetical protein